MGLNYFIFVLVIGYASAQSLRVCMPSTSTVVCQSLDRDDSQVVCDPVESRIDCAIKLARGTADFGVFSEEETVLLSLQQPTENRIVASIRDVQRTEPYAFEAVAVVPANHVGGLEGLRGARYCHPGLDQTDLRWSPRVLKTFERVVARTDHCPNVNTDHKTAEEVEMETLNNFFGSGCRPGAWSANVTVDADLKNRFPNLCSSCGEGASCSRYNLDMGVTINGINNNNRHIQALECLRRGNSSVAYVAWQHVREFFTIRNPQEATSYALMCEDGALRVLTAEVLAAATAPCSFVKQPWATVVASTAKASAVLTKLREWWPNGVSPGDNGWRSQLYSNIIGGANARVFFETTPLTASNYTSPVRNIADISASTSCIPARRWCTISTQEQTKCQWLRAAAYVLGIEPHITCQQRNNIFECLADIRDRNADLIVSPSNYGYLSRQHYKLSSVKLVQNSRNNPAAFSRVAALLKETTTQTNVTRFENLRGRRACFPEYSGIAFVAFVSVAHERGVISSSECDYAQAVGEFFDGACAPGAEAASHAIGDSSFNATNLCTACRPSYLTSNITYTCAYDYSNLYYGNNGSISCLADSSNDVAFVEIQNIQAHLTTAGLQASQVRALCRNNTLAITTGIDIDQNCLLAYVVDSEVLARRDDPLLNALNTLLDSLDSHFGYNEPISTQLINLELYSPFDGKSDLLFKDTVVGLAEPSATTNEAAKNYYDLFSHLESCNAAASTPGMASRSIYSGLTIIMMWFLTKVAMD
ncbi:transferrin-like [Aricia agestis]|uniref:transferrin-like n=1 Tax=Aricia agestis TaxID=91739 RepID=UPI001C20669E|nr:transferrin-like [Aricia agestis]